MQLTGPHMEEFSEALRNAFTPQSLERMFTFKLRASLWDYAPPAGDMQDIAFNVIDKLNRAERIDRLIIAARDANPLNAKLFAFSQKFGLASTPASRQELQLVIEETDAFLDPDVFRQRLGRLEAQVCRIEIASSQGTLSGTGFLVGPSVVMTNYHVVETVIAVHENRPGPAGVTAKPANVRARFGFKRMVDPNDGTVIREVQGTVHKLAEKWLIDASAGSPLDRPAPADRLDYALLQLATAPGDETLDGPGGTKRGFVELPAADPPLPEHSSLFILQHPKGGPLKLGLKTKSVLGTFDNGARVRYTTPTEHGSSGSPCFTPKWELAALHHSGDPDFDAANKPSYNEGIPMAAIRALLKQRGLEDKLGTP